MAQPVEKKASESAWRTGCVIGFVSAALLYAHLVNVVAWQWVVPGVAITIGRSSVQSWDSSDGPAWVLVASALAVVASAALLSAHFVALAVFVVALLFAVVRRSLRTFRRARTGMHDGQGGVSFADGETGRTLNKVKAGMVSAWAEESASVVGYRDAAGTRYRVLSGAPGALLERRLRTFAHGALVLAVLATASSIFLSETSKRDSQATYDHAAQSTASPESTPSL